MFKIICSNFCHTKATVAGETEENSCGTLKTFSIQERLPNEVACFLLQWFTGL